MTDKPWWRQWNGVPAESRADKLIAETPPQVLLLFGAELGVLSVVAAFAPGIAAPFLGASAGALVAQGERNRRARARQVERNAV